MPVSAPDGKEEIKEWVTQQDDIKTIVDVGPGCGTYYDLLGDSYSWIGIEIFEPYIKEYDLEDKYGEIIIGDVREVDLPYADLIIFGDVLEHMKKDEAIKLIKRSEKYKYVIASVPVGDWPQDAVGGNEHERHLAYWTMRQLEEELFPGFSQKLRCGGIGVFIK